MSKGPTLKMKKRLNFVVITAIVLVFAVVFSNLVRITVFQYDEYKQKAIQQQLKPETIPANRGTIYDRNMGVLAQSATAWDVVLAPLDMVDEQKQEIANKLAEVLSDEKKKIEPQQILDKTKKKNRYEIIKTKLEKETADKIRKLIVDGTVSTTDKKKTTPWKGVDLVENTKRYYPNGVFASSLIGFSGTDQGLYGLELSYNKELSGTPGYVVSSKNGVGENMPVNLEEKFEPINGNNLVLTLDETIQHFLEKELQTAMDNYNPKMGCAGIVMDVNTGEILAMANLPSFDLNKPFEIYDKTAIDLINKLPEDQRKDATTKARGEQWSNKSISYAYQPGSVFKTVVASAALEEKTSSLNSTFYCPGYVMVADRRMSCHKHEGHGSLDFTGALVNSCNPAFVKIGADLGADSFFKYFKGFGLTEKTGIDLPGEGTSQYYTNKQLGIVSLASCSFGQSMAVTPIQMVTAVSAVVNGGNLVTPYVVKDILDQDGNVVKSTQPNIKRQVISDATSAQLKKMMEAVVDIKGGSNAKIKGYRIGGKSGTSQKQNPGDSTEARIGSYIAVAPADNPKIAVYIMIDEPTTGGQVYGSVIAAPVVAEIMKATLPYIGINPQYTEEELATKESTMPFLIDLGVNEAQSKLSAQGLGKPKVIGNGKAVIKQVPSPGNKIPKDGLVILYTESDKETLAPVPNVVGLSPSDAKTKLEAARFNVIISGLATNHANSKIVSQNVGKGVMKPIGTIIEIKCIKSDTD